MRVVLFSLLSVVRVGKEHTVNWRAQHAPIVVYIQYTSWWWATNMPEICRGRWTK